MVGTFTVILASMAVSAALAVVVERFRLPSLAQQTPHRGAYHIVGVSFFLEYFEALPFTLHQ